MPVRHRPGEGQRPPVRCGVLGPLEVTGPDGTPSTPSGILQRRLLTCLVLRRGRVVPVDTIADVLWPDRLPNDHISAVHSHVFRLRRKVPDLPIEQEPPGYRLRNVHVGVDADEFEATVAQAIHRRREQPADALRDFDEAVSSWRGTPYVELADVGEAGIEAERLGELLRRTQEERLATMLDLGRADEAVGEAEALLAQQPLRERRCELLIHALAATGRRAEALRAFDDLRRRLAEELGIDPSPQLRALNEAVLSSATPFDTSPMGADRRLSPIGAVRPLSPATEHEGPATAGGSRSRLPVLPRRLVGREELVAAVTDALGRSRVVTLVGTGGVGKTSLALETASRLTDRYPGRVCFAELSGSSSDSAATDVLSAFGAEPRAASSTGRRIASLVDEVPTLLVLDNCEHVLDQIAPIVEDAVAHSTGTHVLATSRERLLVAGEVLIRVPPLSWTDGGDPSIADAPVGAGDVDLQRTRTADPDDRVTTTELPPALSLFLERASDVGVELRLDHRTRAVVADICERLDGLPLAIELAANRLTSMRLEEIRDGLGRSIRLLSGGRRAVPRHRSIAAALAWSTDLLDTAHRNLLTAAAAFSSPFAATDVAAVAGHPVHEVVELLTDLVDRSLVHRVDDRFALLEPVRQFVDDSTMDDQRRRVRSDLHARRMGERADEIARDVRSPATIDAVARSRALVADLRAAFRHAIDGGDLDLATRLCISIRDPAFHALIPEPLTWAAEAAVVAARSDHPSTPDMYAITALALWTAGDLEAARRALDTGLLSCSQLGVDPPFVLLDGDGTVSGVSGRFAEGIEHFERAIAAAERSGDVLWRAEAAAKRVLVRSWNRDPDVADAAAGLVGPALPGDCPIGAAWCWYAAGEAVLVSDPPLARDRLVSAVHVARSAGAGFVEVIAGASLASLEVRHGDPVRAAAEYRWLLPLMRRGQAVAPLWTALRCVAQLLLGCAADETAAMLLGAVTAPQHGHRVFGDDAVHLERVRTTLAGRLGAARLGAAMAAGAALDDAAATTLATAALDEHLPA